MNRQPVKSSNVKSIGYDPATGDMEIEYHGARVYRYPGVPTTLAAKLEAVSKAGGSVGGFVATHIKPKFKAIPVPVNPVAPVVSVDNAIDDE